MASGEEPSESLKYKTQVLKVSIHCEGCRKKVHRILKRIPGVYETEIDARQHKVTVKAIVDAETLIRKLEKSGKHAQLWPETKTSNQNPSNGDTSNKKESKEISKSKEPSVSSEKKPNLSETNPTAAATVSPDAVAYQTEAKTKHPTEPSKTDSKTEESATKEPQTSDAKKTDISAEQLEKSAATAAVTIDIDEKTSTGKEANVANGGGKKVQKESKDSSRKNLDSGNINSLPPQHMYTYPTYPPPPAYLMSYNMAQPSISQAHYAPPVPPASQGYMYMPYPPAPEFYSGPSDLSSPSWMPPPPPPHDNLFSDENPNGCNLM